MTFRRPKDRANTDLDARGSGARGIDAVLRRERLLTRQHLAASDKGAVVKRASIASSRPPASEALRGNSVPSPPPPSFRRPHVLQRLVCSQSLFVAGMIPGLVRATKGLDRAQKKALLSAPLIGIVGAGGQLG